MQEHKQWFYFAESDLVAAKSILHAKDVRIGPILYMCQQSVEKSLKCYLLYKNQPIKKTHNLIELIQICSELDANFLDFLSIAIDLTPYATKARYPDLFFAMPDISVAEWATKEAEKILKFVEHKIW